MNRHGVIGQFSKAVVQFKLKFLFLSDCVQYLYSEAPVGRLKGVTVLHRAVGGG